MKKAKFIYIILMICLVGINNVYAEGSKDLVENGGYRPYTERNGLDDHGIDRKQVLYVRVKKDETIYLATSVKNVNNTGLVNIEGNDYSNNEVRVRLFENENDAESSHTVTKDMNNSYGNFYDTDTTEKTGYISTPSAEKAGPNITANIETENISDRYTPFAYTANHDGILKVEFYSTVLSTSNPTAEKVEDQWVSHGSTVAAWDITVVGTDGNIKDGRVYTKTLFLNIGKNIFSGRVMNSIVYVYTDDAYIYKVDFNGMDPYGFMFYANARGLLYNNSVLNTYEPLYHSVHSTDNYITNGLDNIYFNIEPVESEVDETYKIFFNKPDESFYPEHSTLAKNTIINLKFEGKSIPKNATSNTTLTGTGGKFTFNCLNNTATQFQIKLNFSEKDKNDNIVFLSGKLKQGTNSVLWDGKDAKGNIVQPGTYTTELLEVKGGEVHFPLLDVENNEYGIIIERMNGVDESNKDIIYYNNINDNSTKYNKSWTAIAGGEDHSIVGEHSSSGGLKFHSTSSSDSLKWIKTGNQSVIDMWTYINAKTTVKAEYIITNETEVVPPSVYDKNPPNDSNNNGGNTTSTQVPTNSEFIPPLVQQPIVSTTNKVVTGDNSNIFLYIVIGGAALVGIIVLFLKKKK